MTTTNEARDPRTAPAPRLGLAYVPTRPPETLRDQARAAERAGLDELWVWEDCFKQSAVASAAAALAWTERIDVGVGLMPAPLRAVALAAMEIATIARTFPGRFTPAVGHGVQFWMGQAGVRAASPLTLLREHAEALRRLLSGAEVSTSGRYVQLDAVRLDWPPVTPPPLLLGGSGPRSLELAGRLGDGLVLTNALTPDEVAATRRTAFAAAPDPELGAADASRRSVVATIIAATGPDAQARVDAEVVQWGAEAGRGVGAAGDADALADAVRAMATAGATSVVIQPTQDEPDLDGFIKFLGREVRPRLHAA